MTIWIIEMYKVVYRKCINIPLFPYKSCPFLDDPFHVIWMSKQMLCHGGKTHTANHHQKMYSWFLLRPLVSGHEILCDLSSSEILKGYLPIDWSESCSVCPTLFFNLFFIERW